MCEIIRFISAIYPSYRFGLRPYSKWVSGLNSKLSGLGQKIGAFLLIFRLIAAPTKNNNNNRRPLGHIIFAILYLSKRRKISKHLLCVYGVCPLL